MVHFRHFYRKVIEKRKQEKIGENKYTSKAKYIVYDFVLSLQYLDYEAIVQLGTKYATNLGVKIPRMLSWTANTILQAKEVGDELKKKKVGYKLYLFLASIYLSVFNMRF